MELKEFFQAHPRPALAFSGGTDSAYLLWAALRAGAQVRPYFVQTPFQPAFALAHARRLAAELGVALTVLEIDVLAEPAVAANPPDRCYHCKRLMFTALCRWAAEEGCGAVLDGTNASDDAGDRPGMRALAELGVLSPLRLCGLTKAEIRRRSAEAGLFTARLPAYACLATRIPAGEAITPADLRRVEGAENALAALGFTDFRLRLFHGAGRLQVPGEQLQRAAAMAGEIRQALAPYVTAVLLDLQGR